MLAGCTSTPEPAPTAAPTETVPADRSVTADLNTADGKVFRISTDFGALTLQTDPSQYTDWTGVTDSEDFVWIEPAGSDGAGGGWPAQIKAYGEPGTTTVTFTQASTGTTVTFTVVVE
jgi:hypothetical protein